MTTFMNCSHCGRDSGLQGNAIVATPEDQYVWTVKCPRCAKRQTEQERERVGHAHLLAEFTKAALPGAMQIVHNPVTWPQEAFARSVLDVAQRTLDEYLKRLDGRDSDTALLESLEWSDDDRCPVCRVDVSVKKHKADCKLARRLGR